MREISLGMVESFQTAVGELDSKYQSVSWKLADKMAISELHAWLDANDEPLPWSDVKNVTSDEWFFITTLYGEMTLDGQRTHIRRFFKPLFVETAGRDIRGFISNLESYNGLRSSWMKSRLCKMATILRDRGISMDEYVTYLQALDTEATPDNPMPSFDAIIRDHCATGWKTLSVFIRDCVLGNCFPIDSRVEKSLAKWNLPVDERLLVSLCLEIKRNPREIARMFYGDGGE